MKKILLTGSTGFLGSEFLNFAIKKKYHVTDIIRSKNKINKILVKKNNHKSIYFGDYSELENFLNKKKFDVFINFATHYKNNHSSDDLEKMIKANILFPNFVLDKTIKNIKKFITFGTMMEYSGTKFYKPQNLYSSTKKAFDQIMEYYKINYKHCSFHNIKLYESFSFNDVRKKIIPEIFKAIKLKCKIKIINKNLKLNIVAAEDINSFLIKLINQKQKSSNFLLRSQKDIKILNLIKKIQKNKNLRYEIKNSKTINNLPKKINKHTTINLKRNIEKYILEKK